MPFGGVLQQGLDLGAALDGDGGQPGLADPLAVDLGSQVRRACGYVADDAFVIDDQRDVGSRREQLGSGIRVDFTQ